MKRYPFTIVIMKGTEFIATRRQCSKTIKSFKVHGEHGAQFQKDNLNYWIIQLLLHG